MLYTMSYMMSYFTIGIRVISVFLLVQKLIKHVYMCKINMARVCDEKRAMKRIKMATST